MKHLRSIMIFWSAGAGCFFAEVLELPKLITDGASRVEALRNAEAMIDAYLKTAQEAGWQIPEPRGRMAFA
jgi:predicted RNase H-like HicB family nuclease